MAAAAEAATAKAAAEEAARLQAAEEVKEAARVTEAKKAILVHPNSNTNPNPISYPSKANEAKMAAVGATAAKIEKAARLLQEQQ